jgi:hypothetical protein
MVPLRKKISTYVYNAYFEAHSLFSIVLLCLPSSFRLSLLLQFCMLFGSCYNDSLLNQHWITFLAHLRDPFCLVKILESFILIYVLIVYPVSRCFSTGFQHQGMGFSQRYCPEMYEYDSISTEQDIDAS